MAGPYQRLSNGQSADSGAQAITTVVNAVEAGLEDAEATITAQAALIAGKAAAAHTHSGTYDPAGSAAAAQAAAVQRANHTGTQLASTISNFDTQVRTNRLDQMAAPTAAVGMGSQRITGLGTPSASTDAATKAYADSLAGALYGYYNVRSYGATGDGTTNDTAAINAAIAALNTAGTGVLYLPLGSYKVTTLTTITAKCTIRGEGSATLHASTYLPISGSSIVSAATSGTVLTLNANGIRLSGFTLMNTNSPLGTAPTSGSGITVPSGAGNGFRWRDVDVRGFYVNVDVIGGAEWAMDTCYFHWPALYNLKIRNIDIPDGGDMGIVNTYFGGYDVYGPNVNAHIRWESGGGLRITNCKFNGSTANSADYCIDAAITDGTGVFVCHGNSFENWSTGAIRVVQSGAGRFGLGAIAGNQFAPYGSGKTYITLSGVSTSTMEDWSISGNVFSGNSAGSGTSVSATNVGGLAMAGNLHTSGQTLLTQSGCTRVNNKDV